MSKVIVHIDLNAFFVRAEEIKDPSLENKPVAVGGTGRAGIVSTCSYEARKYGVRSGMPMFKATQLCPNLIIKRGDYHFYVALSTEFINFIKRYTKLVEQMSIDECFADFTDVVKNEKNPEAFFRKLQNDLYKETKLRCSIGVAPTKFLAKMGSDLKKPMGLSFVRKRDVETLLYPLPISDMFGIGKKTFPRLMEIGINTIGDLAMACKEDRADLDKICGKYKTEILDLLEGRSSDTIETVRSEAKSIGHSVTFMKDTDSFNEISFMFETISKEVSHRCKMDDKTGTTVQIMVKDTNFKVFQKSRSFENPTNDWKVIYKIALDLYEKNFSGLLIRQAGVTLQNLISPQDMAIQMSLFDYEKHEEESSTKLLINELNRKLKKPLLMRAAEVEKKKTNGNN